MNMKLFREFLALFQYGENNSKGKESIKYIIDTINKATSEIYEHRTELFCKQFQTVYALGAKHRLRAGGQTARRNVSQFEYCREKCQRAAGRAVFTHRFVSG